MKKHILVVAIVVVGFASFVAYTIPDTSEVTAAPPAAERSVSLPTALIASLTEYEAYLNEALKQTGTPGAAVAIVKDSSIIFLKGLGVRSNETRKPVDAHTVFRLGSVSKCFASTLTAILVQDSILSWDDPVIKYVPGFALKDPEQTQKLTIRHVLSHTTGLPYHAYTNLIEEGWDLTTMLNELRGIDLVGNVGTAYSYQNVAYSLIDVIIQGATGKSYQLQMEERLFGPLHMADASMSYERLYQGDNTAKPHLFRKRKWRRIPISETYYNTLPAGGVNASATDMAKWMMALIGNEGDIISQEALDQMFDPQVRASAKNRNFNKWSRIKKSHYGLGWRILDFANDTLAYHGGYVNGYRSEVAIHPKEKIGICVLTNAPSSFADQAIPAFLKFYDKHNRKAADVVVAAGL